MLTKHSCSFTCVAGAATVYTGKICGKILAIIFTDKDFINNGATDLTFTGEDTGTVVMTGTNVADSMHNYYPRAAPVSTAAAAITNAYDYIWLHNERLKLVVADGDATGTGSFFVLCEE